MSLEAVTSIGPSKQVRVVEAAILKPCAINRCFSPDLAVGVMSSFFAFLLIEGLLPLVHLDLALETVAILGNDAEVAIAQVYIVSRCASEMNKLVHVLVLGPGRIPINAGFLRTCQQVRKSYSSLLILPEYNLGEGNEEEAKEHYCETKWVVMFVHGLSVFVHFKMHLFLTVRLS